MKKITLALGLSAVMAAGFTSCDTYDIYPEQYGKVISIKYAGDRDITVWSTDPTAKDSIIVMKGGHNPEGTSKVSLRAMTDADWNAYMEETRNEGLLRIPAECCEFEGADQSGQVTIDFNGDKDRYSVQWIHVKSPELISWFAANQSEIDGGRIPVLPVMISSTNPGDSINADNKYVMYHPVISTPQVGINNAGAIIRKLNPTDVGEGKTLTFDDVKISLPSQLLWDFDVFMAFNPNVLLKYQAGHEDAADWQFMEKSWVSFEGDHITPDDTKTLITYSFNKESGKRELPIGVTVDLSQVNPETDINNTYVVPLTFVRKPESADPTFEAVGLTCQRDTVLLGFVIEKVYNLHELAIDETMVTSNVSDEVEGPIDAMFDDNTTTFWHSNWHADIPVSAPFYAYIEIAVPETGLNSCGFVWTNRGEGNTGVPSTVAIYATDVETPTNDDWWLIGEKTNCEAEIGTNAGASGNIGDERHPFISEKPFTKVRFCVSKSTRGAITTTAGNSNYFNCSEFRMLGGKN